MKFTTLCSILACAGGAYGCGPSGHVVNSTEAALSVSLARISNSRVAISVTNVGSRGLNLLEDGTFLDPMPVPKVTMFNQGSKLPFLGIKKRVRLSELDEEAFTPIQAGETLNFELELASVHDIQRSGKYRIVASGAIPYAELGSTMLTGNSILYESNEVSMDIDRDQAQKVKRAIDMPHLTARTALNNDCTGNEKKVTEEALRLCAKYANMSAEAVKSGEASKFKEYFKTIDMETRKSVYARFQAVARECGSTSTGGTTYRCKDQFRACRRSTLAYTVPSRNVVVPCPMYFSVLPMEAKRCHGQDQWSTTLHEFTHAPGVMKPGTDDKAYGYSANGKLSAKDALDNADTYALFANAIALKC